jgi:hypothetical protein
MPLKKLSDYDETEKESIEDEVSSATTALGMNAWSHKDGGTLFEDQVGICHNCNNLDFCQSEFGNVLAICTTFKIRLSGQNRITKCNQHNTRGAMDVNDMTAIATIIDLSEKKINGFVGDQSGKRKVGFNVEQLPEDLDGHNEN